MKSFLAGFAGMLTVALIVGFFVMRPGGDASRNPAQVPEVQDNSAEHPELALPAAPTPALPFPVDIDAKFALTDHTGRKVTQADYAGKPMAVFFGFASCQAICSVALPRLGQALDLMGDRADEIAALMITVDPDNDTVDTMGPALAKWHPKLVGLTGSEQALAEARASFQVQSEKLFDDPEGNPIYAHGSFIYFIGADGKVRTIMPPILGPERMAEVMSSYL